MSSDTVSTSPFTPDVRGFHLSGVPIAMVVRRLCRAAMLALRATQVELVGCRQLSENLRHHRDRLDQRDAPWIIPEVLLRETLEGRPDWQPKRHPGNGDGAPNVLTVPLCDGCCVLAAAGFTLEGAFDAQAEREVAGALEHLALALARSRDEAEVARLRAGRRTGRKTASPPADSLAPVRGIVGSHPLWLRALEKARKSAKQDVTVFLGGRTGTGKELVARLIHEESPRGDGPFVAVNAGSLAETLLEAELFGYVKGSHNTALEDKPGLVDAANGGTLFLDEVGDMSPGMQKRLLRVLEEQEVLPVGATQPHRVDVRVVAATHRDLKTLVEQGEFREDLYYRLMVVRVLLPALEERREDIPALALHLHAKTCERFRIARVPPVPPRSLELLRDHDWPGNVRHLEAVIARGVVDGQGALAPDLVAKLLAEDDPPRTSREDRCIGAVDGEKRRIRRALGQAGNNREEAAQILRRTRQALARRMKTLGIVAERARRRSRAELDSAQTPGLRPGSARDQTAR